MPAPRYENSAADKAEDKRNAKKHNMSLGAWEKSAMDKAADAAGQKRFDKAWAAKQKKAKG